MAAKIQSEVQCNYALFKTDFNQMYQGTAYEDIIFSYLFPKDCDHPLLTSDLHACCVMNDLTDRVFYPFCINPQLEIIVRINRLFSKLDVQYKETDGFHSIMNSFLEPEFVENIFKASNSLYDSIRCEVPAMMALYSKEKWSKVLDVIIGWGPWYVNCLDLAETHSDPAKFLIDKYSQWRWKWKVAEKCLSFLARGPVDEKKLEFFIENVKDKSCHIENVYDMALSVFEQALKKKELRNRAKEVLFFFAETKDLYDVREIGFSCNYGEIMFNQKIKAWDKLVTISTDLDVQKFFKTKAITEEWITPRIIIWNYIEEITHLETDIIKKTDQESFDSQLFLIMSETASIDLRKVGIRSISRYFFNTQSIWVSEKSESERNEKLFKIDTFISCLKAISRSSRYEEIRTEAIRLLDNIKKIKKGNFYNQDI